VLSASPSLSEEDAYPVLLPGIDCLNHRRGERVTWRVDGPHDGMVICVETESRVRQGGEVLNNYGLKSNGELILGYGFSIADNPEDVLVIKVRGGGRHEIGRDVSAGGGLANVLDELREIIQGNEGEEWEVLESMMDTFEERLLGCQRLNENKMVDDYIKGQLDIIHAVQSSLP